MNSPSDSHKGNGSWTPRLVAFFCNWCTYTASDLAGVSRLKYPSNARVIRVSEGLLNMVEMAFRAYDPCLGCATHSLPGHLPLVANIYGPEHELVKQLVQG